jgi:hypothetical protein
MAIGGAVFLVIGLAVGFTNHSTPDVLYSSSCGSILGGGTGQQFAKAGAMTCDQVMAAPRTWTWLLLIVAALLLVGALMVVASRQIINGAAR